MQINGGGDFSDLDIVSRMMAAKNGGSISLDEIKRHERIAREGAELGSAGAIGSINMPKIQALQKLIGKFDITPELAGGGMAERIKAAAAQSGVRAIPTAEQAANEAVKQQFQNAPKNFFNNAKQKATELGIGGDSSLQEAFKRQAQDRAERFAERDAKQLDFAKIRALLGNK